jgi:tRNA1(Val) A37 N6-methylase TrmN6
MKRSSLVNEAHLLIKANLFAGDIAIDATVGNGFDTLCLAEQVGADGKVYGFDIQIRALENTANKLQLAKLNSWVTLFHASHTEMADRIPEKYHGKIKAIMFNLGYLPGGDKSIITLANSTIDALKTATDLLAPAGKLTVLAYPGHEGGKLETEQVKSWSAQWDSLKFTGKWLTSDTLNHSAPVLFILTKMK